MCVLELVELVIHFMFSFAGFRMIYFLRCVLMVFTKNNFSLYNNLMYFVGEGNTNLLKSSCRKECHGVTVSTVWSGSHCHSYDDKTQLHLLNSRGFKCGRFIFQYVSNVIVSQENCV